MAELKSYSCPKCGSYLDVDRDRDEFECPFCGNRFNALVFHRDELLAEARRLARSELVMITYPTRTEKMMMAITQAVNATKFFFQ